MKHKKIWTLVMTIIIVLVIYAMYLTRNVVLLQQTIEKEKAKETLNDRPYIMMIGEVKDHVYWNLVREGASDYALESNLYLEYVGPDNSDPLEQLDLLRRSLDVMPDGIIVQGLTEDYMPLINQAIETGIPVITIDSDQPASERISYVGTDNLRAGGLIAQDVLTHVDDIKAGIITGSYTNNHHQLRLAGFQSAIEEVTNAKVVDIRSSSITRVNAREKAYQMLIDYPEINVLYGTSALDVLGITEAIDLLGREDLYVVGFDTLEKNMDLLKTGKVQTLLAQEPYQMGYQSMRTMKEVLNEVPVEEMIHTDSRLVKRDDV